MKIGIFDSGIGGVTVLNEVKKRYPYADIVFFGDTLRLPYGNKTKEQILLYSRNIVKFLLDKNVDIILVACNTATSLALRELKEEFNINILGTISPVVNMIIEKNYKKVGLIATSSTIKSNKYLENIREEKKDVILISKETPLFVPVIEEGIIEGKIIEELCNIYIEDMKNEIEALILGCTHYMVINDVINAKYPNIDIISSSLEIVNELEKIKRPISLEKKGNIEYYVSGDIQKFRENLKKIFNITDANIQGGNLDV